MVIGTAAAQYANRPADESFADLPTMIRAAQDERENSREVSYNLRDLRAIHTTGAQPSVQLLSPKGAAGFTHWAFGQFCRMLGAPASYLRDLPAHLAAQCVNHGIAEAPTGTSAQILVRTGDTAPVVRSVTSESYGRLWDCELYSAAEKVVFSSNSVSGQPWIQPPTWDGGSAGTWRGDRDSFVIRVDGGSIVTDPSLASKPGKDGRMYRGILLRNSEVGASSIVIDWVLFEYVCGNLNLWGAVIDKRFRRRHVGTRVLRETMRELSTLARQWTQRSAAQDEAIIRRLIDHQLAHSKDAVIDELRAIGYTKDQAAEAMQTCDREFVASPFSYWGIAQGTTRNSQGAKYQDERYELDQLAAKVMARGARVVSA